MASSVVTFRELGAADIDRYLASGEWRDRAGAYAIQGLGSTLAERVEGDLSNVIGLPVALLFELAPELRPAPESGDRPGHDVSRTLREFLARGRSLDFARRFAPKSAIPASARRPLGRRA